MIFWQIVSNDHLSAAAPSIIYKWGCGGQNLLGSHRNSCPSHHNLQFRSSCGLIPLVGRSAGLISILTWNHCEKWLLSRTLVIRFPMGSKDCVVRSHHKTVNESVKYVTWFMSNFQVLQISNARSVPSRAADSSNLGIVWLPPIPVSLCLEAMSILLLL